MNDTQNQSETNRRGIAIIGIGCRFPGADDWRQFWSNLCGGVDSIHRFSDSDLLRAGVLERTFKRPDYVKASPILNDYDMFDAGFFEYSPREARLMDPQQRILLEEAWHALEDAGHHAGNYHGRIGAFVGSGGVVTSYLLAHKSLQTGATGGVEHLANDKDFVSTKLSYKLDLTGPSINVQTACSTSMVAVHLACQSILDGECDMALAGAATVRVPQISGYLYRQGDIMSPDGTCRAYDADAQGTVFGSGAGVVVLKHIDDAIADGDHIYAVILGSALNNDGASKVSYTASSTLGQARAMASAFAAANVEPSTIGYVEGHGTGTVVGDPLEVEALQRCFATDRETVVGGCYLGSVKTNIGHLEQAAGIASLIKAALSLHHRRIPPTLNFRKPNPRIDFDTSAFRVTVSTIDWPADAHPRRAAVNSLGLGGTNAFAILEEAPVIAQAGASPLPVHLLTLSAQSKAALSETVDRWRDHLATSDPEETMRACYTAAVGRSPKKYRLSAAAIDGPGLAKKLISSAGEARETLGGRKLAFIFPGQGAQYPGMAQSLHGNEPAFRDAFDIVAARLSESSGVDIAEAVFGAPDAVALTQTKVLQPALFAIEWSLAQMLKTLGVSPDAVLGHSVGAYAAAAVAGIFTVEDAADLIARRASLMGALPAGGTMVALFADEAQVIDLCSGVDGVVIAAANSPSNTVVAGDAAAITRIEARANTVDVMSRRLTVSHAFHSPLMEPAAKEFALFASERRAVAPRLPFISDMTGSELQSAPDGQYLSDHVLQSVRFADGLYELARLGCTDFLEIGPGNALRGFVAATLGVSDKIEGHGILDAKGDDWAATMQTVGRLWEKGYEVDIGALYARRGSRRCSAPVYPFQRTRYWLNEQPENITLVGEALCGTELKLPGAGRQFQARYSAIRHPWQVDHRVYGHITLPVVGALIALSDAASQVAEGDVEIRDLTYHNAFVLADDEERLLHIDFPNDITTGEVTLSSVAIASASGTWQDHIRGTAQRSPDFEVPRADLDALRIACPEAIDVGGFYACLDQLGLNYGKSFRNVRELTLGPGFALGRIALSSEAEEVQSSLHPAMLDACLHLFPAVSGLYGDFSAPQPGEGVTFLPISIEEFHILGPAVGDVWSYCSLRQGERPAEGRYTVDVRVYASDGAPIAVISGLAVKQLTREQFSPRKKASIEDWLYGVEWVARPALTDPVDRENGRWVVIAERPTDVAEVTDALSVAGETWEILSADILLGGTEVVEAAIPSGRGRIKGFLLATAFSAEPLMSLKVDELSAAVKRQFRIAQEMLRLVSEEALEEWEQPKIWILTRGAQAPLTDRLGGEAVQSVLWGHGRVIALEHTNVWGGLIDVDHSSDGAGLVRELLSHDGEDQIAIRDGRRFAPRLIRRVLDSLNLPVIPGIRSDRSYLVTGGLGSLGLKVAKWLVADQGARHVCLVSRRAPSATQKLEISALNALGARIHIVSADVSDQGQVVSLIKGINKRGPDLDGVFHCAGLLNDGIMIGMEWEQYHQVTAPKIEGAWALHQATEALKLGHFVLFSSVLSLIGSMGQLNYVAGNAFLDALVAHRRRLGLAATAMNWGPWEDAGLATSAGERGRAIWRARGTSYIPADSGMEIMHHTLAHGFDHMAVTLTDWPRFVTQFAAPPRLYEKLTEGRSHDRKVAAIDRARVMERIKAALPEERHELVIGALGQICASNLELDSPPTSDMSLREAGLDSLMSITVINDIEEVFGTRLPARALLQGPSISQLADMVMEALPGLPGGEIEIKSSNDKASTTAGKVSSGDGKSGSWLVVRRPRPNARVRLFCFPFAGGGSAVFDSWGDAFDPSIEIVAVEPPGRLSRINEDPVRTVEEFARSLMPQISNKLDKPFAVLGHCLGGLTLYETLRFLEARKRPMPEHIFVSGARPPSVLRAPGHFESELEDRLRAFGDYHSGKPGYEQPDDIFVEIVRSFGITDSIKMLEQSELRDLVLPTVRAEFEMAGQYVYVPEDPFPVPITCFRGDHDEYFRPVDARIWRKFTSKRFELHTREVGHFAIVEDFDFIRKSVEERLLPQCARSA
jgi:acyl transferase domain-containing protein/acyl carrier protein